jgi:hypothetical protein
MPTTFDIEAASRIGIGARSFRIAVEVRVVESGVEHWCDLNRTFPIATIIGGGDPGLQRLVDHPTVTNKSEKSGGQFGTQPVTLRIRNDDSLLDRTDAVVLLDSSGVRRTLPALKRARCRLRFIEPDGTSYVLGQYYIDKISASGAVATVDLQPLLRLLQTISPAPVKQGDHWFRDVHAAEMVRRLVQHALPGVVFDPVRFPSRIFIPVRAATISTTGHSNIELGPAIDNLGRQPESIGSVPTTDADAHIPTAIARDGLFRTKVYYATTSTSGGYRLFEYTIASGSSREIRADANGDPICFIWHDGIDHLFVGTCANNKADFANGFLRKSTLFRIHKNGTGYEERLSDAGRWSFCDFFVQLMQHGAGTDWSIGTWQPTGLWAGEQMCIGFPQLIECLSAFNAYTVLPGCYPELSGSAAFILSTDEDAGLRVNEARIHDRGGWQSTFAIESGQGYGNGGAAAYHHAPFPKPFVVADSQTTICSLVWSGTTIDDPTGVWRLARHEYVSDVDEPLATIAFPDSGFGNQFKQHQPTAWCVVDGTDFELGTPVWLVIATLDYRNVSDGDNKSIGKLELWKVDLEVTPDPVLGFTIANGGLTLLGSVDPGSAGANPNNTDGPWPVITDMVFERGYRQFQNPHIQGCIHDRKVNLYRPFMFRLDTLTWTWRQFTSGAPLTGWVAYQGEVNGGGGARRVFFRDCASGSLYESHDGGPPRQSAHGRPVDSLETWEAVPQLCVIEGALNPATDTLILGFSGPAPPLWAYPQDTSGNPPRNVAGSFRLWQLGLTVTARLPVADFRGDLVKSVKQALDWIAQSCGPSWTYGFDPETGAFYFDEFDGSEPAQSFIDADDRRAEWSEKELPAHGLVRDDETGEDITTEVAIIPWEPVRPAVGGRLEYGPRPGGTKHQVSISVEANTEAARRVILNVVRDGTIGPNDYTSPDLLKYGDSGYWDTNLLLSWTEDAEDILTETLAPASTLSTIRVRGMTPGVPANTTKRRYINGTLVVAQDATFKFPGDWIQTGSSSRGRISGFVDPDVIQCANIGSLPSGVVLPVGTTVTIQPARGRNLSQSIGDRQGFVICASVGGASTGSVGVDNGEGVHPGNVIFVEEEAMLVTKKQPATSATYSTTLFVVRGYLGTKAIAHSSGPYRAQVFIHPRSSIPQPIGATGLTIAFAADPTAPLGDRVLQSGDRIILDYPGVRAERAKFDIYTAEDPVAVGLYGKRSIKLDENPYVSASAAPHLSWLYLQALKFPRLPFRFVIPLAPELPYYLPWYLRSTRRLPSEAANNYQLPVRVRAIAHDFARGQTVVEVLTTAAPTTSDASGGAGWGASFGGG